MAVWVTYRHRLLWVVFLPVTPDQLGSFFFTCQSCCLGLGKARQWESEVKGLLSVLCHSWLELLLTNTELR